MKADEEAIAPFEKQHERLLELEERLLAKKKVTPKKLHQLAANLYEDIVIRIRCVQYLAEHAPDYATVTQDLARLLHRIAVAQFVTGSRQPEELEQLAGKLSPESVQLLYEIATRGTADLRNAPDGRTGLEMTLLRMIAFRPDEGGSAQTRSTQAPVPQYH